MAKLSATRNPSWWTTKHTSAWQRAKDAFARDWEQTKADFSASRGRELDQDLGDTVRQAIGREPIPPVAQPNDKLGAKIDDEYGAAEPALRYGFGASNQFTEHKSWDGKLETKLREDWNKLESGTDWDAVRNHVRSGWERARRP